MKFLIACCSFSLGSASPAPPSRACPADASATEARARESRANAEYAAGNYGPAGALYDESAGEYAECDKYHLRRMTAIERSTRAYERAHDAAVQAGDRTAATSALTQAIAVAIRYLNALARAYPGVAEHTEGYRTLYPRLVELRARRAAGESAGAAASPPPPPDPASLARAAGEPAGVDTPPPPQQRADQREVDARGQPQLARPDEVQTTPPPPVVVQTTPPKRVAPERKPDREPSRWRSLAAGGGVSLAAGIGALAVTAVYSARNRSAQREYDDIAPQCHAGAPDDPCAPYHEQGRQANILVATGLVAAPLLLGTGVALVVLAARRRHAAPLLRPAIGPTSAGLTWEGRF